MSRPPSSPKLLSVLCWNANGIQNKISELRQLVIDHSFDLILVQETKCKNPNYVKIQNYNLFLTPRADNGTAPSVYGGTAIYVKKNIPHSHVLSIDTTAVENTIVKININPNDPLYIVSTYTRVFSNHCVSDDLKKLFDIGDKVFLGGDFNAHHPSWNSHRINTYGRDINSFCTNNAIEILPTDLPSRFNYNGNGSFIDFFLLKNNTFPAKLNVMHALSSDHLPIIASFEINATFPSLSTPASIDWAFYTNFLSHSSPLSLIFTPRVTSIMLSLIFQLSLIMLSTTPNHMLLSLTTTLYRCILGS